MVQRNKETLSVGDPRFTQQVKSCSRGRYLLTAGQENKCLNVFLEQIFMYSGNSLLSFNVIWKQMKKTDFFKISIQFLYCVLFNKFVMIER